MRGQVKERIQSYVSQIEVGLSRAAEEETQQLEKEAQAVAMSAVVTSSHSTQALVGTIRDELQVKMDSKHRELQRQNEMMQSELQKLTNDVQTLTKQLNGAKLINREMLDSV